VLSLIPDERVPTASTRMPRRILRSSSSSFSIPSRASISKRCSASPSMSVLGEQMRSWDADLQYWWHFYRDGTFDNERKSRGVWTIQGKQLIATATNQGTNRSTWVFEPRDDGNTMAATWSDPNGGHGQFTLSRTRTSL
jgi:hypothetical protein